MSPIKHLTFPRRIVPPLVGAAHRMHGHSHHGQDRTPRGTHREPVHQTFHVYNHMLAAVHAIDFPKLLPVTCFDHVPILSALLESRVQIGSNNSFIQLGASNVLQAVQGILVGVVFNEAESAGCLVETIEAHDQSLDLAAPRENQVSTQIELLSNANTSYLEKSSWICSSVV